MSLEETLIARVRTALAETPDPPALVEKRIISGVGFMAGGNLACAVNKNGLLVRVGPAAEGLSGAQARPFEMRGKAVKGWLLVEAGALASDEDLRVWVGRGLEYARSLPAK